MFNQNPLPLTDVFSHVDKKFLAQLAGNNVL